MKTPPDPALFGDYELLLEEEPISEGKMKMNAPQVEGVARIVLTAIAAILGTLGYMKGVDMSPLITVAVAGVASWWSIRANKTSNMVRAVAATSNTTKAVVAAMTASPAVNAAMISAVAESPDVREIVTTSAIANADPNVKVTAR